MIQQDFKDKLYDLFKIALEEDGTDATSNSIFSENDNSKARLLCKEDGILAALDISLEIFRYLDPEIKIETFKQDHDKISKGDILAVVEGNTRTLLRGERICLNILQRACGIATVTEKYTSLISHTKAKILDTRKTAPGLRFLDKYAVLCGSGKNHRFGLNDMVMIKDNHVDRAGGITKAVNQARASEYSNLPIEVECRTIEDVKECLSLNVDRIMLDNMSNDEMSKCVSIVDNKIPLEASGGINLSSIKGVAETGIDYISIGALTHSVKALDISMKFF